MSRAAVHARVYCLATTAHELRKRLINQNKIEYHKTIPCGCSSRLRALPCHYSDDVPNEYRVAAVHACVHCLATTVMMYPMKIHNQTQDQTWVTGFNSSVIRKSIQMHMAVTWWNSANKQIMAVVPTWRHGGIRWQQERDMAKIYVTAHILEQQRQNAPKPTASI